MENPNLTFYATFYKTTISGKNIFKVHGTDEEIESYIKSQQKRGVVKIAYLTQSDQKTLVLNENGQKVPLHFSQDKPISKLLNERFPMVTTQTGANKGSINPDLRLVKFVNDAIKEYGPSNLDFCISEARTSLAHAIAQDYQDTEESSPSQEEESPVTEESTVDTKSIINKIASGTKKKSKS
tara:strand:- start:366 stop:911 length:546 start_codon:yes stop_codon:yes gene_type:complete